MQGIIHTDIWYGEREHRKFQENGYIVFPRFLTECGLQVDFLLLFNLPETENRYSSSEKRSTLFTVTRIR